MAGKTAAMQQLKAAAARAAARAASAKEQVRSAKALLKQARKAFKSEKKAAKQARRKVDAAATSAAQDRAFKATATAANSPMRGATRKSVRTPAPRPALPAPKTRALKPQTQKPRDTVRSAADVAKSVIERLHGPPPTLPPEAPHRDTPLRDGPGTPSQDSAES